MVSIRKVNAEDLIKIQGTNLLCLPENYSFKYYIYHYLSWPYLLYLAEDYKKNVVGYVLAKLEEDDEDPKLIFGHITSISVLRSYRRMGLATKLMKQALHGMQEVYSSKFCSLHVRSSNVPALRLYNKVLGFEVIGIEIQYYADKEDAYKMKYYFDDIDKEKESSKFVTITDNVKWEEIANSIEEVDANGEEIDNDAKDNKVEK